MKIFNLSKTYTLSKNQNTPALNGISFELPERGMVFILGRSGSGKSTLLNILSGLDGFDGGDVIFEGKSFKEFTDADRNAYRNGCCGFVFQEYNLIPELTVGENVALALELQGKKHAEKSALSALADVGLEGYYCRKPATLSGGQKQRVAIARAIVKQPKIIFADEPTGALDQSTGRDILQLLKNLSRERLVVVVSHDREFANEFGDRIIELADGKIAGDSSPATESSTENSEHIVNAPECGLPIKHALKIGCRNFLKHPLRFVTAIILSVAAFSFLGLSLNIAAFDSAKVYTDTLYNTGAQFVSIHRYHSFVPYIDGSGIIFDSIVGVPITDDDEIKVEREQFADIENVSARSAAAVYNCNISRFQRRVADMNYVLKIIRQDDFDDCLQFSAYGFAECSEQFLKEAGYELTGRLPLDDREIAIPECILNLFIIGGLTEEGEVYKIADAEDIIGHKLPIEKITPTGSSNDITEMTIVGVVDTHCGHGCFKGTIENCEHMHEKLFVCSGYIEAKGLDAYAMISLPEDRDAMQRLAEIVFDSHSQTDHYELTAEGMEDFEFADLYAYVIKNAGYYLSAIFLIFAILFMGNFIAASVRGQLKQFGILRATGASFKDCAKIYLVGALIIAGIVFIVCAALLPVILHYINIFISATSNFNYTLLSLNYLPYIVLPLAAVVSALAGSLPALLKYGKQTPAEIIRKGQIK